VRRIPMRVSRPHPRDDLVARKVMCTPQHFRVVVAAASAGRRRRGRPVCPRCTDRNAVRAEQPSPFQKILSANRKRTIANMAKNAAISPPTTQKPFGLPLNGIPPTFMPQIPAISVAGRNIAENIVSM
jgi:hypothetical protein